MAETRIFTLADSGYFVGCVTLAMSIRRCFPASAASLTVLDSGLTDAQRRVLCDADVGIITLDLTQYSVISDFPDVDALYDTESGSRFLYCDADVVFLRHPGRYLAELDAGKLLLLREDQDLEDRCPPDWKRYGEHVMRSPLPYVNSGFIGWQERHFAFIRRWLQIARENRAAETVKSPGFDLYRPWSEMPWMFGWQDALNVALRAHLDVDDVYIVSEEPTPRISEPGREAGALQRTGPRPEDVTWAGVDVSIWHFGGPLNPWVPEVRRLGRIGTIAFETWRALADEADVWFPGWRDAR